jgi:hypothetical protein
LTQRATEQLVGSEALVSSRMTQVDARVVIEVIGDDVDPSVGPVRDVEVRVP